NDIGEIVADVAERFANRDSPARATVGIRCANSPKSEIDRDVRMGRAAEHLHCERWLNSARAFFQKANVLLFRFADAAERRPETDSDPVLRFFARIFDSGVVERELCRRD